jgi:outer membrane lipoprotein-sorting protein
MRVLQTPIRRRAWLAGACALLAVPQARAQSAQPSGREIVEKVESLLWANTMQGEFDMRIVTPRWERTLSLRIWMERPKRSFVRVLAPAKEAGIGSLRIGNEMWNYLPAVERTAMDGELLWKVEALPKPEAAVVWGRIVYWVRRDFLPVKQEYFSDRGELARVMTFGEIRAVGGRTIPTRWEMKPLGKPGNSTTITVKDARYNVPIDDDIFSQRNLQKR